MSVHQVPSGHRFERFSNGEVAIQVRGDSRIVDHWAINQGVPIIVDAEIITVQVNGGGGIRITVHDMLWLSGELGMKVYDIGADVMYVVGLRESVLGIPEDS